MSDVLKYPRGSVFLFTYGEYSDSRECGLLVTTSDCDLVKLAKEYEKERRTRDDDDNDDTGIEAFPSWLIAKGHALPVDYAPVHLGAYGEWDRSFGIKDEL